MKCSNLLFRDRVPWIFFILFSFCICFFTPSSFSQNYFTSISGNPSPNLRLNEISPAAFRHFRKNFKNISSETWVKDNNFFIASFTKGAIRDKVYYSTKGDFEYEIKCYGSELLKKELNTAIHERFEGYLIKTVMEITGQDNVVYFIKILNSSNIKTLRCDDTGITVTEDYINGGV